MKNIFTFHHLSERWCFKMWWSSHTCKTGTNVFSHAYLLLWNVNEVRCTCTRAANCFQQVAPLPPLMLWCKSHFLLLYIDPYGIHPLCAIFNWSTCLAWLFAQNSIIQIKVSISLAMQLVVSVLYMHMQFACACMLPAVGYCLDVEHGESVLFVCACMYGWGLVWTFQEYSWSRVYLVCWQQLMLR